MPTSRQRNGHTRTQAGHSGPRRLVRDAKTIQLSVSLCINYSSLRWYNSVAAAHRTVRNNDPYRSAITARKNGSSTVIFFYFYPDRGKKTIINAPSFDSENCHECSRCLRYTLSCYTHVRSGPVTFFFPRGCSRQLRTRKIGK